MADGRNHARIASPALGYIETGEIMRAKQIDIMDILAKSDAKARSRPRARGTDPQTSHRAAKRAAGELTRKQQAVLDCFRYMEALNAPYGHMMGRFRMTDPQLIGKYNSFREKQNWPAQSDSGIRTRRHELVKAEKIEAAGETRGSRSGRAGRYTLWATKRGK